MHFLRCFALLLTTISIPYFAATVQAAERPNVVIVYTDDQGSVDTNAYGAKDLTTPNMDRLAAQGIRFTQFYAAAPVCSPSRAALLTGRTPQAAGVPGNVPSHQGGAGMPAEQVTLAEIMRAAGYQTAHIGKWHLGYTPETMPRGQGFDYTFGHMGGCIDNFSHFFYWNGPNRHDLWRQGREVHHPGEYFPALMVEEATQFIEENLADEGERPFFMYFAMNVPHYPYQGSPKWLQHYQDVKYPRNLYAAFLSTQDEYIGKLLDALDRLKIRDNTIVVFQSDHGHSTEERAHHGGGSAGPYRGAKFSLFEGGIRVPAIIRWPGKLAAGEVRGQMAVNCDWLPTILDLCDIEPASHTIDGKSLVPVLKSAAQPSPHKTFHWQSGGGRNPQWAVRHGDWKLIGNPRDTSGKAPLGKDDKLFLVNLAEDVSEIKNLAAEQPKRVQELKSLHEAWVQGL